MYFLNAFAEFGFEVQNARLYRLLIPIGHRSFRTDQKIHFSHVKANREAKISAYCGNTSPYARVAMHINAMPVLFAITTLTYINGQ